MLNVYWTIREDAKVSIDAANQILAGFGIGSDMMNEVTDRRAVKRGVDTLHNRKVRGSDRRISEKIRENDKVAVFGVLKCQLYPGIDQSKYAQDTKVKLNKETGAVEVTGEMAQEVTDAIQANRGFYNDEDIRRLCYNVLRSVGAVSKRPSGGIYLLPAIYADKVDALRNAVKALVGNNANVYVERVYDGDEERANMADSVADDMTIRVEKIVAAVNAISKQTCRLQTHKSNVQQLRDMTNMYRTLLGDQVRLQELDLALKQAEDKIVTAIETVSARTA
jgi:hypothetical protein